MSKLPRPVRWRGFTLLEMLVVVLIIGMVAVGALLTLGATGRDSQLEQERDRLQALIAYTRDRSALMATEYGIRCGEHGYRFVYYDNFTMRWLPETLDDTLRLRRLPRGLDLQLTIEGRPIVLDDKALQYDPDVSTTAPALGGTTVLPDVGAGAGASSTSTSTSTSALGAPAHPGGPVSDNTPQIMLLSNGDTNSFALTFERSSSQRSVTVKSNPDGAVSVGDIVEAPR